MSSNNNDDNDIMMDKEVLDKSIYYFSNNLLKNNIGNERKNIFSNEDYKFYKKRIFQTFKDVMLKRINDPDLVLSFEDFAYTTIKYLKFKDKSMILQEEYKDLSNNKNGVHCYNTFVNKPLDKIEQVNHLLARNLNVKTKSINECLSIKHTELKERKPMMIPKNKDLNLKDPKFKKYGLKNKQKEENKKM